MGLFDKFKGIFARRQSEPPERPSSLLAWGLRSDARIFVNEDAALSCSTAWACGSLIARSIGMLPAHVMAPRSDDDTDGNERMRNHPVEALLHRQPNPEMSAMAFRERLLLSAIFHGNGYAEIERDSAGRPLALWGIHPDRVCAVRDESGRLLYEVTNGGANKVEIPPEDMFHLAGPSIDGPLGLSLLSYARHSLGLSIAQERFASSFIANAGAPSGIVKVNGHIKDDGMRRLQAEFNQINTGPRTAGKVYFLDANATWEQIGLSMLDAEFLAQRRFSVEEICSIFGVPPQMIGDQSKATFANVEQAGLNFLTLAVLPWVTRFEAEANRKLFRSVAGRRQPFVKLNTSAIVRANIEARNRSYALGRQWGWLSVNDIRRLEDMPPIGPEGDIYLQPMNMESAGTEPPRDDEENVRQLADLYRRAAE
jgi:HK97 family phage portal protein